MPEGAGLPEGVVMDWFPLAILLALSITIGWLMQRRGVPAAYLIAGMALTMASNGAGLTEGRPPTWLAVSGFLMLGSLMGARLTSSSLSDLKDAAIAGVVMTVLPVGIMLAMIALIHPFTDASWITLLVAFAPGAIETMAALAIIVKADATFVAAIIWREWLSCPFWCQSV